MCDCHAGRVLLVACGPSSDAGSAKLLWRCTAGENGKIQIEIMNNITPEINGVKREQLKDVAVLFSSWFIIALLQHPVLNNS